MSVQWVGTMNGKFHRQAERVEGGKKSSGSKLLRARELDHRLESPPAPPPLGQSVEPFWNILPLVISKLGCTHQPETQHRRLTEYTHARSGGSGKLCLSAWGH